MSRRLSTFISLVLRHKPEEIGIIIEDGGWTNVNALIKAINQTGRKCDFIKLRDIVDEDQKGRYSFNEDKTKIRANQGHSINIDMGYQSLTPPEILYHGTATRFMPSIEHNGIQSQSRQFVHLSEDVETATIVGKRHGTPIILQINTLEMIEDGFVFYQSQNGVWLTKNVAPEYFEKI